jgi:phospholipase C
LYIRPAGLLFCVLSIAVVAACGGNSSPGTSAGPLSAAPAIKGSTPISHVVIVIQENRSFDNLFATYPGADGTTIGHLAAVPPSEQAQCPIPNPTTTPLREGNLVVGDDFGHKYSDYQIDYDGGKMDGFDVDPIPAGGGKIACLHPYQYVNPSQIQPYWDMAQQYVLADHLYQTQGSGSFTAHQDLIAGGTVVNYGGHNDSIIDNPTGFPWGCDSPSGTVTSLITTDGQYLQNQGPFPCFTQYDTLRDRLDAKGVSWKDYSPKVQLPPHGDTAGIWNGFDAISAVRYSPQWGKRVTSSNLVIFKDITNGRLPNVVWITPNASNSDHPQEKCGCDTGPSWVASIVDAIGQSKYWNSSAIVVLWDDWGGLYDHESPAFFDNQGGLGFRVPMLIVSPYVQPHVEHTQYEFGSILKFVEDNWNLKSLGTTDVRATSIANAFDFNRAPRRFKTIRAKYARSFFLHQRPSKAPLDNE